jgi:hypothetical protein
MPLNSPCPLIPFFPPKYVTSKINLEFTLPRYANCREDIVTKARDVSNKSAWQPDTVVRVEQTPRRELVTTSNGVHRFDMANPDWETVIVLPTVRVLEELSKVVQMKTGAISVPTWKAERWVRAASGS